MANITFIRNNQFKSKVIIKVLNSDKIVDLPAIYHSFIKDLPAGKYFSQHLENIIIIWVKVNKVKSTKLLGKLIANVILELKSDKIALNLDLDDHKICKVTFSLLQRIWSLDKFKTIKPYTIKELEICLNDSNSFSRYSALIEGINICKELAESPANIIYPESFVSYCQQINNHNIDIEILGLNELQKLGMNALLAVSQGSSKEPRVMVMKYKGDKISADYTLGFVGKGVCFDSGGLFIKQQNMMPKMKYDKSAAAAVVGGILAVAKQKLNVNVIGVVGLVENMPDGNAIRPSDVITSMAGITIEIANPDAEGRLVLADCLYYTYKTFKPSFLITIGTLTGETVACLIDQYAGLFSKNNILSKKILKAGKQSLDKVWQLPMGKAYAKQNESNIADLKNVGLENAGDNAAAAEFLERFSGGLAFAHLDIAGVAWNDFDSINAHKGATGYGVKLIEQLCQNAILK